MERIFNTFFERFILDPMFQLIAVNFTCVYEATPAEVNG